MKRNGYHFWVPVIAFGFFLLAWSIVASACPGCKEALFDPKEAWQKQQSARGYNYSIGLLLAVPATLVGGTTTMLVRANRRKKSQGTAT